MGSRRHQMALALVLMAGCSYSPDWAQPGRPQAEAGEGSRQLQTTVARLAELEHARETGTLGFTEPLRHKPAPGWAGERVWHRRTNDWEPAIAADPSSPYVYQLTTRYGSKFCGRCPDPWIAMRWSEDGGITWSDDRPLCRCRNHKSQHDPQVEVAEDGVVYAVYLEGFNPGVAFTRSTDSGRTWSKPVYVHGNLKFSDKPILAISPDGRDVYVALNASDSHVAVSHDYGVTFSVSPKTNDDGLYYFAGGGYVAPDGAVTFGETAYHQNTRGRIKAFALSSSDGGQTWRRVLVESFREWPPCRSRGCPRYYYGPQAAIGGDADGALVFVSNGADRPGGRQRIYVRRSTDGGQTWSKRDRLSPRDANAAFPAVVGTGDGDFRIWFMDDRKRDEDAWNVWYRRSTDGGVTWTPAVRISDAGGGPVYKRPRGFREPYGDYGEIAITSDGRTIASWGEAISYFGPGGTWFNREVD